MAQNHSKIIFDNLVAFFIVFRLFRKLEQSFCLKIKTIKLFNTLFNLESWFLIENSLQNDIKKAKRSKSAHFLQHTTNFGHFLSFTMVRISTKPHIERFSCQNILKKEIGKQLCKKDYEIS